MSSSPPSSLTTENMKCVGKWDLFDGVDVEDDDGELIEYHYPHEATAKALCSTCPVFDWCRTNKWDLVGVIIAGKTSAERGKGRRNR